MWSLISKKRYNLSDDKYLTWIKPKFPNINTTIEKYNENWGLKRFSDENYRKIYYLYDSNDIVVETELSCPKLSKFNKNDGEFPVILQKVRLTYEYSELKTLYYFWKQNNYGELGCGITESLLKFLVLAYATHVKNNCNINQYRFIISILVYISWKLNLLEMF